jgi:hypothetical protein
MLANTSHPFSPDLHPVKLGCSIWSENFVWQDRHLFIWLETVVWQGMKSIKNSSFVPEIHWLEIMHNLRVRTDSSLCWSTIAPDLNFYVSHQRLHKTGRQCMTEHSVTPLQPLLKKFNLMGTWKINLKSLMRLIYENFFALIYISINMAIVTSTSHLTAYIRPCQNWGRKCTCHL